MTEFHNHIGTVPVGEKYDSVTTEHGTIRKDDIIVWEDPDCHYHDKSVISSLFVGYIRDIYKMDRDSELQFGASLPVGRLKFDRNIRVISGKEIYFYQDGHKNATKFVDRFLNSEYEKYMNLEWTRNGDFRVSGE